MAEQQPEAMTEEQVSAWVREHFQAANKYLAEQGIISDQILSKDSRYLAPYVAVWKFNTQDKKTLWVINGDVPTDVIGEKAAKDARDAMRYFALRWQMQAEGVLQQAQNDPEKQRYANYLVNRAENLYQLSTSKDLWQQQD
ncbi:DUF4826 family protein [Pseudidiomarina marina]|uniref:DUF4826 domain-containing protein n=1 Tax=Pseudidiomarina marina TaxID=502366 RepID=A0A432YJT9_9GAMM|nr:DUF4826 family protein [Pseudidiomarina marina]RUO61224.1 DUF4826 domain-containing protein [Pseudidiomarina marina]